MPLDYRRDPMEGAMPCEDDICGRHGQNRDSCGRCWDEDREREQQEAEQALGAELGETEIAGHLLAAVERALSRIRQREDETKGVVLAARFDKETA